MRILNLPRLDVIDRRSACCCGKRTKSERNVNDKWAARRRLLLRHPAATAVAKIFVRFFLRIAATWVEILSDDGVGCNVILLAVSSLVLPVQLAGILVCGRPAWAIVQCEFVCVNLYV